MKKKILTFALLLSTAGAIFAQSTADQFVLPRHSIMTAADFFGQSIAKNDNYVLVGSPDDDLRAPTDCQGRFQMTGAAVLYKDGKPLRAYTGKFTLDGTHEVGWRLGESVAMGAEWLAMGAPSARLGKGAVMLVKKDQTGEFSSTIHSEIVQPVLPGVGVEPGNFGKSVAIGRNTLIIGAYRAKWQGVTTGLVFVYKLVNGNWSFSKLISPPSLNFGGHFGEEIALSNDEQKVIIGATGGHTLSNGRTTGSALIYTNTSGTTWALSRVFTGNTQESDANVGYALDISNDRAVILSGNNFSNSVIQTNINILKLDATGKWVADQSIGTEHVFDVAIEGTKLVYGQPTHGTGGRVVQLERSGTTSSPWVVKSTVGLQQVGANPGFTVDLSNNEVAAGLFTYDYADIIDPCNSSPEFSADENAGGAMLYNFDRFNNSFYKNIKSFRNGEDENSTVINTLSVSPNPAEGGLVNIQVESTILDVAAVNALGVSTVLSFSETGADISNLTSGVYVLKVKTEMGNFDQKLLIK